MKLSDSRILLNSNEVNPHECDKTSSSGSSDDQSDHEQVTRLKEQSFSFGNGENGFVLSTDHGKISARYSIYVRVQDSAMSCY